jgi:hypothetical protein
VKDPRRWRSPWRCAPRAVSSLVPLVVFSLVAAVFITQSGATLADSSFQSPQSPVQTPAPEAPPMETAPGPSEELPVVPPAESPVVPPSETPGVSGGETPGVPPVVEPGETPGVTTGPLLTPSAGPPGEVGTAEPPGGEEAAAPVSANSLAVLIDALVVGLSSLWLCCGGLALVIFFLLVVASFVLRVT